MGRATYPEPHPLLRYRLRLGISLRGLARRARLRDHRRIAVIERGLSATEIRKIALALGCCREDLQPGQMRQEDRHAA